VITKGYPLKVMKVVRRTHVYLSRNLGSIVADKQTKVKPKPAFLT